MSQGRQGVVLWSLAGAMLLVAGVFVVVAMRPSSHVAPAAERAEEPAEGMPVEPPSASAAPEAPANVQVLQGSPVSRVEPRVGDTPAEPLEEAAQQPAEPPPAPGFAPLVPPVVGALRDVRLAVPISNVLQPGTPGARPPAQAQRLDGMEGIVAGQEAEIRRLEQSLAEAERIGDIDDARLRRGRLTQLRRVHGGLEKQLTRMRAEAASATNTPPSDAPARTAGDVP